MITLLCITNKIVNFVHKFFLHYPKGVWLYLELFFYNHINIYILKSSNHQNLSSANVYTFNINIYSLYNTFIKIYAFLDVNAYVSIHVYN